MSDYNEGSVATGSARSTIVTGFFDSRAEAERASERLQALGLGGQVRVTEGATLAGATDTEERDDRGFFERLGDFLFPDEDRSTFAEGLARGGFLVTASGLTSDAYDLVMDALEEAGAVDIDERAASWRSEGWSGDALSTEEGRGRSGSAAVGSGTGYAQENTGGTPFSAGGGGSELAGEGRSLLSGAALGASGSGAMESARTGTRDTGHGWSRARSYTVGEPEDETLRMRQERIEEEGRADSHSGAAATPLRADRLTGGFRSGRVATEAEVEAGLVEEHGDDEDDEAASGAASGLTERDVNRP